MDVLKNITDGLRSGGKDARDETERTDRIDTHGRDSPETIDDSSDKEARLGNDGPEAGESTEGDEHLCSFCETEFDAERDTCPECDARIVLRGAR
jgi:hypothetical protein